MSTPSTNLASNSGVGVVLVEPRIPQNAGNITRLCACTGARLYLLGDLGFHLDDKYLDRSAMDYKAMVEPLHLQSFEEVQQRQPLAVPFYTSSKAVRPYWEVDYPRDVLLVFGSETHGLPEAFVRAHPDTALRIPMVEGARSLNLANSVSIVLYEVLRQHRAKGWV